METWTLKRDGDRSLTFEGVMLASASSRRGSASRWFEVSLYRTAAGSYVVAGVGRSDVDGETDRHWVEVVDRPADVVEALKRDEMQCASCGGDWFRAGRCGDCGSTERKPSGQRYLTNTARDALNEAAESDDGVREAFLQRVA